MAVVFGESGDWNIKIQLIANDLPDNVHLTYSAVGYDEVGQGSAFFHHAAVTSAHHLLHRGVVVRPCDGLYIVFPIVLLARFHALEYHAGGHGIAA